MRYYAPVNYTEKNTFYYSLSSWIEQNREPHSKLIVCGDFNVTNFSARIIRKQSPEKVLHDFLKKFKLSDVYLEKCESKQPGFTYYEAGKTNVKSRIDYILVDTELLNNITKFELKSAPTPDYKALQINVEIQTATSGPSYWKMDISVLDKIAYQDAIKKVNRK